MQGDHQQVILLILDIFILAVTRKLGRESELVNHEFLGTSLQGFWSQPAHDHKPRLQGGIANDPLAV